MKHCFLVVSHAPLTRGYQQNPDWRLRSLAMDLESRWLSALAMFSGRDRRTKRKKMSSSGPFKTSWRDLRFSAHIGTTDIQFTKSAFLKIAPKAEALLTWIVSCT
jgi:hypothetical protein